MMTRLFREIDWFSARLRAVFFFLLLVSLVLSIFLPESIEKIPTNEETLRANLSEVAMAYIADLISIPAMS